MTYDLTKAEVDAILDLIAAKGTAVQFNGPQMVRFMATFQSIIEKLDPEGWVAAGNKLTTTGGFDVLN